MLTLLVSPHPLLEVGAFVTRFAAPLGETPTPPAITALMAPGASAPEALALGTDDALRTAVRDLLRAGGFKPSGRSKPAAEYLVAAFTEQRFPRINAAVDACNVASLHSGLPISLIDLDRIVPLPGDELRVACAPMGTSYVFNPSGQVIDAGGLLCVNDAEGPSGTPVKDAQRSKTHDGTRATLAVVWGTKARPGRAGATTRWYRELLSAIPGATHEDVAVRVEPAA